MTSPAPAPPATGALFADLFDDAALFPPASLSMGEAFDGHRIAQQGGYRWMLGRFVVASSRLTELASVATHFGDALRLSLVVDDAADADDVVRLTDEHGWGVDVVETVLRDADVAGRAAEVAAYSAAIGASRAFLELPWGAMPSDAVQTSVASLGHAGVGVKIRCGGADPSAFPEPSVVAAVIASCRDAGVPLKATAGLHHPFRHPDPEVGVLSHGFVNLLAAATIAYAHGASANDLAEVVADESTEAFVVDGASLRWIDTEVTAEAIAATRRELFVSIGTCSFREPVDDLVALGLLPVP